MLNMNRGPAVPQPCVMCLPLWSCSDPNQLAAQAFASFVVVGLFSLYYSCTGVKLPPTQEDCRGC